MLIFRDKMKSSLIETEANQKGTTPSFSPSTEGSHYNSNPSSPSSSKYMSAPSTPCSSEFNSHPPSPSIESPPTLGEQGDFVLKSPSPVPEETSSHPCSPKPATSTQLPPKPSQNNSNFPHGGDSPDSFTKSLPTFLDQRGSFVKPIQSDSAETDVTANTVVVRNTSRETVKHSEIESAIDRRKRRIDAATDENATTPVQSSKRVKSNDFNISHLTHPASDSRVFNDENVRRAYYCEICKFSSRCPRRYSDHLGSSVHRNLFSLNRQMFYCTFCTKFIEFKKVVDWGKHLGSKKHKKNVEARK